MSISSGLFSDLQETKPSVCESTFFLNLCSGWIWLKVGESRKIKAVIFRLRHMLVNKPVMALPMSLLMDVAILAIIGSPVLLLKYLANPTQLGFFCNDEVRPDEDVMRLR